MPDDDMAETGQAASERMRREWEWKDVGAAWARLATALMIELAESPTGESQPATGAFPCQRAS